MRPAYEVGGLCDQRRQAFPLHRARKAAIHATPLVSHIKACLPWLEAELTLVDPALIVCLGATAARALLGSTFRVTKQRGEVLELATPVGIRPVLATVHPSAVLRATRRTARRRSRDWCRTYGRREKLRSRTTDRVGRLEGTAPRGRLAVRVTLSNYSAEPVV